MGAKGATGLAGQPRLVLVADASDDGFGPEVRVRTNGHVKPGETFRLGSGEYVSVDRILGVWVLGWTSLYESLENEYLLQVTRGVRGSTAERLEAGTWLEGVPAMFPEVEEVKLFLNPEVEKVRAKLLSKRLASLERHERQVALADKIQALASCDEKAVLAAKSKTEFDELAAKLFEPAPPTSAASSGTRGWSRSDHCRRRSREEVWRFRRRFESATTCSNCSD